MNTSFWLDNPNVLLNKNQITEIWPQDNFDLDRKLNAITRLILVLAILGFLFTKSSYIIVSAAVSIVVLVMIHKSKSHSKEGMENLDIKINKEDFEELLNEEFTMPTKKNPFMNVLINEYKDNPTRKSAAPVYNEEVLDDATKKSRKDERLYKNLGDNLTFQNSLRNFYSTANTSIPNNQKEFAEFCYGNMASCKEGDEFMCEKNNGRV
uniref:Minor capsid protein P9 transmembrane helices domain-containing protein n=1 Tax=viral metagenome TaxID=1070528 RepID=A0A6C0KB00_9ZZZZ